MKKLLIGFAVCMIFVACKKNSTTTTTPTTPATTTPVISGDWVLKLYDGTPLTAPTSGTIKFTHSSTTAGTVHFDITFDGSAHNTEDDSYTLSSNNTKINFTKTGGTYNVLSGGGNWTVDTLTSSTIYMTSQYGLIIKATK